MIAIIARLGQAKNMNLVSRPSVAFSGKIYCNCIIFLNGVSVNF